MNRSCHTLTIASPDDSIIKAAMAPIANENPLRIIIAAGGTGGHVYPGIAIASRLRELEPEAAILFVGTEDRMEARTVPAAGFQLATISVHGIAGKIGLLKRLRALAELALCLPLWQSLAILRRFRPQVVVGTGGYVCGPVLLAARLLRIPSLTVEQNQIPGFTSQVLAGIVSVSGLVSEESKQAFYRHRPLLLRIISRKVKLEALGIPVRPEILHCSKQEGISRLGLDPDKITLVAFGGSIGSLPVNRALVGALEILARRPEFAQPLNRSGHAPLWYMAGSGQQVQVLHLIGRENAFQMPEEKAKALSLAYFPLEYLDQMEWALAAADIVVARAGGSGLAEITARGIPAIIIPWAGAANNHQEFNAQPLRERGAAIVISDRDLSPQTLADAIWLLVSDPAKREAMARASKALGIPDAADRIIEAIRKLIG